MSRRGGVGREAAGAAVVAVALAACAGLGAAGCHGRPAPMREDYFRIKGFYVFPLTQIHVGMSRAQVEALLGAPVVIVREPEPFRDPVRVKIQTLPPFDEEWCWPEGLANSWVFFKNGKVTAAFREESDW